MDSLIRFCYALRLYRVAYAIAARYMPPIHPLNFQDERFDDEQ